MLMAVKIDPIVEKVKKEGLFGKQLSDVDLSKPFEAKKPEPEATVVFKGKDGELSELDWKLRNEVMADIGKPEEIRELIRQGANPNAKNASGESALHLAITDGTIEAVQALIAGGADVNAMDNNGVTPLHLAALESYEITAMLNLAPGINPNAMDKEWKTPLMYAANHGDSGMIIGSLLSNVANANMQDNYGWTALMCAAQNSNAYIVRILLTAGKADHTIKNNDGMTALDIALDEAHAYKTPFWYRNLDRLGYNILMLRKHGAVEDHPPTKWEMLNMPLSHLYYYLKHKK